MEIKEVEYGRLFNLENYQNERIAFRVALDENEDANAVIGQLFFKVLQIEESLQLYRDYIKLIKNTEYKLNHYEREIEDAYRYLAELENRRKKLEDEKDSKAKMCHLLDIDDAIIKTKERIEKLKKERDAAFSRLKALRIYKDKITEWIKAGEFDKILREARSD